LRGKEGSKSEGQIRGGILEEGPVKPISTSYIWGPVAHIECTKRGCPEVAPNVKVFVNECVNFDLLEEKKLKR